MKAALLYEYGGPEQLQYEEVDIPKYGEDDVLVKVRATSINPIDYKLRSGAAKARMPLQLPAILGRDLSGEVAKIGRNVKAFNEGMRVMALTNRTYAEYTVVKADLLEPIPDGLTFEQAAALPLVTITGSQLIEHAVKIQQGQTVLVTGALGGVGRTAVHVAHKHRAKVLAGVRSTGKKKAEELRADGVVALDSEEEIARLHDLDAIADTVGGETIKKLFKTLRSGGVIGSVLGEPGGAKEHNLRVEAFMAQPDPPRMHELAEDVARQEFSIPIARVMKLADIQKAHRLAEKGAVDGKIVLVP